MELARKRLDRTPLTLCVVKEGHVIFESLSSGISGFMKAVEDLGDSFEGASVGDRVVGRAIAFLCVHVGVRSVYAVTLSERGKSVLEEYGVYPEWDNLVDSIMDVNGRKMCPFEELASEISDPDEAYMKLKSLQRSLSNSQKR